MVLCSQCGKLVDERSRATCPHCFAQLPQVGAAPTAPARPGAPGQPGGGMPGRQPQPGQYAGPMATGGQPTPAGGTAGGARVSLTGEVIESDAPAGPPSSYAAAPGPPGAVRPAPVQRPAGRTVGVSSAQQPAKRRSPAAAIATAVAVLVLVIGLGGYWFVQHAIASPKVMAAAYYAAIANEDYRTLYVIVDVPAETRKNYPDADSFAKAARNWVDSHRAAQPAIGSLIDSFKTAARSAKIGEPTITDDTAIVTVTMDTPGLSTDARRKTKGAEQLTLKRVNGVWRVVPESAPQINMLIRLLGSPL